MPVYKGRIYRDGKFWLAEVPDLYALTQGYSRQEAFEMLKDLIVTMDPDVKCDLTWHRGEEGAVILDMSDSIPWQQYVRKSEQLPE